MSNNDKVRLKFDVENSFVDLSKPYDTDRLYYEVVADSDVIPDKENTLYLPIKGVYFNAILSGEKTKEYREIKDTTYSKYLMTVGKEEFILREDFPDVDFALDFYYNGFFPFLPKPYKFLKLAVGYAKERDWAIVEVVGISFEPAKDKDGHVVRFDYDEKTRKFSRSINGELTQWVIVYHLGKTIEYHPKEGKVNEPAVKYERTKRPHIADKNEGISSESIKRNFDFLKDNPDFADLHSLCNEAEIYQLSDPSKSALSARRALEYTTKAIYLLKGFHIPERASLFELVDSQEFKEFINDRTLMMALHFIRKAGNNAAHLGNVTRKDSFFCVLNLHNFVGSVLMMLDVIDIFPRFDKSLLTQKHEMYVAPRTEIEPAPATFKKYEKVAEETPVLHVAPQPQYFTESETRALYIDQLLREAGWNVLDSKNVVMANSVGIEIKLEGMPNGQNKGFADYVIFGVNGKPLAVIEAKKTSVDPMAGKHQAELYADCLEAKYGVKPVIYYTNGYEIYCIDRLGYPPRRIYGFHSRENLELLIQRQNRKPITDLRINDDITNREYQKRAITSICEHLNSFHRRGLLVMATGTGKTRVSISLVDVLMRNDWVKNVLFLADRTALVKQANKNYNKLLPHVTTSVLSDKTKKPDKNARVLFSTYQTMINFIDADTKEFSVGRFDLIIIDEAHRSIFGKYMAIFNYFDAFLIGLTATPRDEVDKSTYQVFNLEQGEPNFDYELEEAVADGFLNPYEVINKKSKIITEGIKYDDLSEEEKEQLEKVYEYENKISDNLEVLLMGRRDFNPSEMYKYLFNNDTVDKVLQDLMNEGLKIDGNEKIGKTIIFAYNHTHAVQIVERFHLLYPQYGHDFCVLIDNTVNYSQNLIDNFEQRDNNPQIAVSVDMLDTGIDVPDILNLVFFKVVKSKIKFQQMIGRGTRLSDDIFGPDLDKKKFLIFDYCGNFDYFNLQVKEPKSTRQVSLTEKLFNLKLDIAIALQTVTYQEDEFAKQLHDNLKVELRNQIVSLNRNHISVRDKWALVDKYSSEKAWEYLSAVDGLEIKNNISPLVQPMLDDESAKRFDLIMLYIELSLLDEEIDGSTEMQVVADIAQALEKKMSIPQVKAKKKTLAEVQTEEFWDNISLSELERVRIELRSLMVFLDRVETKIFEIDIEDEITEGEEVGKLTFKTSYKQKVLDYLIENSDNPVIQKIKNLEQLTIGDIRQLEKVLWEELGSKEDYEKHIGNKMYGNVAIFIRSLVGIDRDIALEKFSQFIDANSLNTMQLEYLKSILDYVSVNGDISGQILVNNKPFNEFNWQEVYGQHLRHIGKFVANIHDVVTA